MRSIKNKTIGVDDLLVVFTTKEKLWKITFHFAQFRHPTRI
jgi:hypothetical protein